MADVAVKVCGLTSLADGRAAVAAGADFLGFVFAPSPRRLDPEIAAAFWADLPRGVPKVAVFRDQSLADVERVLRRIRPDYLQFHGMERPGFCRVFGLPVIRALAPLQPEDLALAEAFLEIADFFLVDLPKGAPGVLADAVARAALRLPKPVFLAGGLSAGNVGAVVERLRPFGVDVARGVESSPGVKDHELVREFVLAATGGRRARGQERS